MRPALKGKRVYLTVSAIIAAAAVVWLVRESSVIEIRTVNVHLPYLEAKDDGFSVALVSDTHFGAWDGGRARRIAAAVNALDADAVLLLGDYINGNFDRRRSIGMAELTKFVSSLRSRRGVFAVTGNHEMWYGRSRVAAALRAGGAEVITGKLRQLPLGSGGALQLVGLPDRKTERPYPFPRVPARQPLLIAMHDPGSIRKLPDEYRHGFAVAGHTHGGQMRLYPGKRGTSWRHIFSYLSIKLGLVRREDKEPVVFFDRGLTDYHGRKLYISSGLGMARLKVRMFCRPEIALLKLRHTPEQADTDFIQPLEIP